MGVRGKNLKGLFSDARTRTIVVITAVVLIGAVIIGYSVFRSRVDIGPSTKVSLSDTPQGIDATPGSFDPSAQYAKLQEQANVEQAKQAEKTGTSAIPTIIRETKPGEGQFDQKRRKGQPWEEGLGFQQLSQVDTNLSPKSLALDNLKRQGCDEKGLENARRLGASPEELREAGCTAGQLRKLGFTNDQLQKAGYSACDLLSGHDIDPKALKNAGYSAGELRGVGFNACQLKRAGYTAAQLRKAGYTPNELKGVGFGPKDIAATAGSVSPTIGALPPGVTAAELKAAGCSPAAVRQARDEGVSASAMRRVGCTASELKAGGYSPQQIDNAGYSPAQLRNAGLTSPTESAEERQLAATLPPGVTMAGLKAAGCSKAAVEKARQEGVSAKVLRHLGCTAKQLKNGGYTARQLKNAGFTAGQLARAGFTPQQLKDAGYTARQLAAAGFSPQQLKDAGFTAKQLANAGFTPNQLKDAGYSNSAIRNAGYSPEQLQNSGITAPSDTLAAAPEEVGSGVDQDQNAAGQGGFQSVLSEQQQQIREQQLQQMEAEMRGAMQNQATQLFTAWKPSTQQHMQAEPPKKGEGGESGSGISGSGGQAGANGQAQPAMIKAGKIMFAVLDTSVDSDQPGPVLATIVSGRFKGAKLIGTLTKFPPYGKRVMLTFNMMNVKSFGSTIRIDAVAIDPNTARTALSSYTNNHLLLRFGTLFAASFLEGYGQAFLQSGQTIASNSTATIATSPDLSPSGKLYVALGNVGNKFGSVLQKYYNRPPTVHVYAGTGLGILFVEDVAEQS